MCVMNPSKFKKLMIVSLMICIAQMSLASFTGSSDKRSNTIFSLKNFNKNFYKMASPFSLRANFTYKGLQVFGEKKEANGDVTFNSIMRYEKGNTTYIYPYRHRVAFQKFKAPVRELR